MRVRTSAAAFGNWPTAAFASSKRADAGLLGGGPSTERPLSIG